MPLSTVQVKHTPYDTREVLDHVRGTICDMITPYWLGSVPSNFGDLAAGTIKADAWHTLATVYIPITLISLLG
ncbi:hypothetical protein PAXRUDRAFT_834997 [Paxillus rubicundulus Ve08.2h10]|uniref:Uncharacterized protein n=1 Tax=Paxillus rubicundulus Ve08.2h10 TaxID=930991 RepID=A0A0D0DA58_9AGAM|nr:hypothetical protein PAXRUDRAFT_834997 [Paxillus rubicundulus Ve08.2h10]